MKTFRFEVSMNEKQIEYLINMEKKIFEKYPWNVFDDPELSNKFQYEISAIVKKAKTEQGELFMRKFFINILDYYQERYIVLSGNGKTRRELAKERENI